MKLVVDTNVLISAILTRDAPPARLLGLWRSKAFTLLSSDLQLEELARVTRYPKLRQRLQPAVVGELINDLRSLAVMVGDLPQVTASPDPYDNFLLAMAEAGQAQVLVSGDKRGLLDLERHHGTRILSVSAFLAERGRP